MSDFCLNCGEYLDPDCKCNILVDRKTFENLKEDLKNERARFYLLMQENRRLKEMIENNE